MANGFRVVTPVIALPLASKSAAVRNAPSGRLRDDLSRIKQSCAIALMIMIQATWCLASDEAPVASEALDGIYVGLSSELHISALGSVEPNTSVTYVTFYPDGKVYRRVPEGGLEGWNRAAAEAQVPALWGTYRRLGPGRWEIRWNESTRIGSVQRVGDGLVYEDRTVVPVATCEGLLLDGTYVQPGAIGSPYPPSTISFFPTGEFLDRDLIGDLAYQNIAMPNPRTIAGGSGKYRIGRNTLYLEYYNGPHIQVEIHAGLEDINSDPIQRIHINAWPLVRLR